MAILVIAAALVYLILAVRTAIAAKDYLILAVAVLGIVLAVLGWLGVVEIRIQ